MSLQRLIGLRVNDKSIQCGASPRLRCFVKHFWHIPPAVGLILQLQLVAGTFERIQNKTLRMRGRPTVYNPIKKLSSVDSFPADSWRSTPIPRSRPCSTAARAPTTSASSSRAPSCSTSQRPLAGPSYPRLPDSWILQCGASPHWWCFVLSSLRSSGYQLSCTVAAESAKWPVEHVKHALHCWASRHS